MMRKWVVIFSCFLLAFFLTEATYAQTYRAGTVKSKVGIMHPKGKAKHPLILVNGITYHGDISKLDPTSIDSCEVVKGAEAIALYGRSAKNGVINIVTKKRRTINGARVALSPLKKTGKSTTVDLGNKKKQTELITNFDQLAKDSALFILDGVQSDKKLNGILPEEILSIDILKKDKASEIFESHVKNDIVVIVTKSAAIKSYQKKLSQFSKEYKTFLDLNHNDDSGVFYSINRIISSQTYANRLKELYELKADDITKVEFSPRSDNAPATLFITTKKH